jgi:transcriptional regulator with XRE-family HTH domain
MLIAEVCGVADQTFGARLKALREEAGLSQVALADRAGMNQFGIAKLEQGVRQPTWATVEALAAALGVRCTAFEGTSRATEEAPPAKLGRPRKAPQAETPAEGKPRRRRKGG